MIGGSAEKRVYLASNGKTLLCRGCNQKALSENDSYHDICMKRVPARRPGHRLWRLTVRVIDALDPAPTANPIAIDDDPEFFSGLTMWSEDRPDGYPAFAAQVRQNSVDLVFNERQSDGHVGSRFEQEIPLADARRLRDLLNVATARGYL